MGCLESRDMDSCRRARGLIDATYGGRDDLCAAASRLSDEQLSEICRRLADDLAAQPAYVERLGLGPGAATNWLSAAILRFFQDRARCRVLTAAGGGTGGTADHYDIAIAATGDPQARALLRAQSDHLTFAERIFGRAAEGAGGAGQSVAPSPYRN
jgi:hypothetical protein